MPERFTIKELGLILGCNPKKAPQALQPALRKMALLMIADPARGMAMLSEAIESARAEIAGRSVDLTALFRDAI